jgi:hypothetical protein
LSLAQLALIFSSARAHCRATALGDPLSVSSRSLCARWLCCFLRHGLPADGTTTGDLAFCKSHKGALRTLASYAPASTAGFVCISDVSRARRSDVKPLQKWTEAFAASLGARL